MPDLLRIEKLVVSYDGFRALDGLSWSVQPGELRVLIGPNGAGKSTLLDAIVGKAPIASGGIRFEGHDLRGLLPESRIVALGVGRKFQAPGVLEDLSVRDNLGLSVRPRKGWLSAFRSGLEADEAQRVVELLELAELDDRPDRLAGELSHGQKQRLELAMVVGLEPRLILLDEPTAGITRGETERTADLLRSLTPQHAVVVVEHDMDFVERLDAPVAVLHLGKLLTEGSLAEVRADERVREVYLGRRKEQAAVKMLEAIGLNASHSGARVLWDIDLSIAPGEAFALLGRNGAGKTTLLRTLMGLHPLDSGELRIGGRDASRLPAHSRAELGVAYVPQGRGIFSRLTVEENLRLASGDAGIAYETFPKLQQLRTRLGGNLSGGEQQQLAVGRALMTRPRLLILDEPTEGVQPSVVIEIEEALRRAVDGESAPAVLLVEQYLDFPWSFAHRLAVLDKGRMVAVGAPSESGRAEIEALLHV